MKSVKTISIVIRVRNAENDLRRCLAGLREQQLPAEHTLEIIVVDNESTDNSAEAARQFGADVVSLSVQDFSWGRALNRGIARTAGDIVLLLSADAYPANNRWIMEMLVPFENPKVAAVYGRQVPRPDAPIDEIVRLRKTFGETSRIAESVSEDFSLRGGKLPVSNACAAIRRRIWEKVPYDELVFAAEDRLWTNDILSMNCAVAYQSNACVYHSHADSIFRYAWRQWEIAKQICQYRGKQFTFWTLLHSIGSLTKNKIKICLSPLEISFLERASGLLRIPGEAITIIIVFIVSKNNHIARRFREM